MKKESFALFIAMPRLWVTITVIVLAILGASYVGISRIANRGFQWTEESMNGLNQLGNCRELNPAAAKLPFVVAPSEDLQVDFSEDNLYCGTSDVQQTIIQYAERAFDGGLPIYNAQSGHWTSPGIKSASPKIKAYSKSEWNPVGISLIPVVDTNGENSLYALFTNFNRTILQLDMSVGIVKVVKDGKGKVEYEQQKIFRNKALVAPNDLAALSPTDFFITNDHSGIFAHNPLGYLADLLGYGTGQVLYCNTVLEECKVVAEGFRFANSLVLSPDQSLLYVSETFGDQVYVYKRDIKTNELTLVEKIPVPGFVDNLNLDPQGRIWVAASLDLIATLSAMGDKTKSSAPSPFVVYRITPKVSGEKHFQRPLRTVHETPSHFVEVMFTNNGEIISPITVAAPTGHNSVVFGSLADSRIVECDIISDA